MSLLSQLLQHRSGVCRSASGFITLPVDPEETSNIQRSTFNIQCLRLRVQRLLSVLLLCGWIIPAGAKENASRNATTATSSTDQMPYLDTVPDPLEGFNRCSWTFNEALFRGVIYPASYAYNYVVPGCLRTNVNNAGHNLTYPARLINSCLQGRWHGAWEETERFGVNSTIGIAGLFDPATKWRIGRSERDGGQTLA
ncbi:MAG TPA: MlaA family lipoprotein, partial [Verrucomicrobiae bacterium]